MPNTPSPNTFPDTHGLPRFRTPPLVETALSIQFQDLDRLSTVHFGLFYDRVKARYPRVVDLPRIPPVIEAFPATAPAMQSMPFVFGGASAERVRLLNQDNGSMVQLQPDRFIFNWRLRHKDDQYTTYDTVSEQCLSEYREFCDFVTSHSIGEVLPNMCEVLYVNHIVPSADESAQQLFAKLFHVTTDIPGSSPTLKPEGLAFNRAYVIGENTGRLYTESNVARTADRGDVVNFSITGRIIMTQKDQSIEESLRLAHNCVVHAFTSLTDVDIQYRRWGRTDP